MHTVLQVVQKLQQQKSQETHSTDTQANPARAQIQDSHTCTFLSQAGGTCQTSSPHSTQVQVNLPAPTDQLRAFKFALGNLPSAHSPSLTRSLWLLTSYGSLALPWCECINLSTKWYVVLLLPRVSEALSPLRRSLCLTQLQRKI